MKVLILSKQWERWCYVWVDFGVVHIPQALFHQWNNMGDKTEPDKTQELLPLQNLWSHNNPPSLVWEKRPETLQGVCGHTCSFWKVEQEQQENNSSQCYREIQQEKHGCTSLSMDTRRSSPRASPFLYTMPYLKHDWEWSRSLAADWLCCVVVALLVPDNIADWLFVSFSLSFLRKGGSDTEK